MERGPVHFQDFENNGELTTARSFRNIREGSESGDGTRGPVASSMSSFIHREGSMMDGTSIRLHSFGGEAFASMNALNENNENENRRTSSISQRSFGRLDSFVPGENAEDEAHSQDAIVVKSIGGEAFAMLAHMASVQELRDSRMPGASPRANNEQDESGQNSERGAGRQSFREDEGGEQLISESDKIESTPRG